MKFCSIILQFCRCGGLLNAKGNPDGFLSHFSSLRNLRLGRFFDSLSQPAWRSVTVMQADNFCGIFAALILWHKASGFVIARAFAILTAACTRRKCGAGHGCPLPYNGVCGRRECTEICRCARGRRGRRPLQRTAGSLGRFSAFRLPRAFLSCQIQKSDRLIWVSRSGFSDYGASSSPPVDSVGASVGGSVGSGSVGFSVGLSVGLSVGSVGASVGGSVSSTSLATRRLRQS